MKKIKLTESQLRYCLEHLNELNNMGAGIQVAAKTDSSGKVTQQTLTDQGRELTTQGMGDAQIVVDQDTINEGDNEENTQNGGDSELMNIINNEVDPYYVAEKLIGYNDGNFNPIFRYWDEACDYIKEIVWDDVLYNRDDDFYDAHVDDIENNPKFLNPFYDKVYKAVKEYYNEWGPSEQDEIEDREDAEEFNADARREEGGMWEGKVITKKQIKEAYVNKIIKEAKAVYRKKDLK